jgi:hypothetical protein
LAIIKTDNPIQIKKANGEVEPFDVNKLERSLLNTGAKEETISKIVDDIKQWIYPGVTTKKLYHRAFSILRREKSASPLRYKLKHAMLQLGPTGFPFEILIGELFKVEGYDVEVGVTVEGKCVSHEMDVVATNKNSQHLVECKYHKDQGNHVSVQVPLYVHSRVDDIIRTRRATPKYKNFTFSGWVITNTKFSSDSINYSKCSGINLLSWDYPIGSGLKDVIEQRNLYPITVLQKLKIKEKHTIMDEGIVTCSQLIENPDVLNSFSFSDTKMKVVLNELRNICK